MSNYIPSELKDLTASKQRVMQKVINEIENKQKGPKNRWTYIAITTFLSISVILFVFNEITNELESATEQHLDLTKPTFSDEQGFLSLYGITLGDPPSKVIDVYGENYTEIQADGSGADFVMDYDGTASFHFFHDKLDTIILMKIDPNYFDKLFSDYDGFKFRTPTSGNDRYFYSKETGQLLKATIVPDRGLYLYLMHGGKDLLENPDFPKIEQNVD